MLSGALAMFVNVFRVHSVMFYHVAFWLKVGLCGDLGHGDCGSGSG